ncbi:MAG: hypothetical protein GY722_12600, partial [bacterium]|nr:hypothetical protein [bacterium]
MNISDYSGKIILFFVVGAVLPFMALGSGDASLTSSFFGTISVEGSSVPEGIAVSATIGGVELEVTHVVGSPEGSAFRIDVPGDLSETADDEGGVEGDTVLFRIDNSEAPESGIWRFGSHQRIDLTVAAGPDLSVAQDDGR